MKLAVAIVLALTFLATTAVAAVAPCRRPAVEALVTVEDPAAGGPSQIIGPAEAGPQLVQWVALRWEGPRSGKVVVLDCGGRMLGAMQIGYVESLKAGPMVGGAPTVEVLYVDTTGPNFRFQKVALLQFRRGEIRLLWDHEAVEVFALPGYPQRVKTFRWRYLEPGPRVEITGREVIGEVLDMQAGTARGRVKKLPEESWCYRPLDEALLPCRD